MRQLLNATRLRLAASLLLLLSTGLSLPAFACRTGDLGFGSGNDLNDYGAIMLDADDSNCAQNALYALTAKVQATLTDPNAFHGYLDGYLVAIMFASVQRLGANGWASKTLDDLLVQVEQRYLPTKVKPYGMCGNDPQLSTCMDVDMAGAAAYAWMAGYEAHRMRDATFFTNQADSYLHTAMSDTCLFDLSAFMNSGGRTLCGGSVYGLTHDVAGATVGVGSGTSVAMPLNHQIENPNYGFGLMTSAASAVKGMLLAGHDFQFTDDEKTIAGALFAEMQARVDQNGKYTSTCAAPSLVNGVWTGSYSADCGDPSIGYHPGDYGLYDFYVNKGLPIPPATNYQSTAPNPALFDYLGQQVSDYVSFFGLGRYVTYVTLADTWVDQLPAMMPYNRNPPQGYLDGITSTGIAEGWACDADMPSGNGDGAGGGRGLPVDLYDSDWNLAAHAYGNQASETAVNTRCGGGTAHRFGIQLPAWTKGKAITAYGLDYTWLGFTQLPCLQSPQCSW